MATYGLIGRKLDYSFSKTYFNTKFQLKKLDHQYLNFELAVIEDFASVLSNHHDLRGINVTIPYKKEAIAICNHLSDDAKAIGAVNCLEFINGQIIGHNTDWSGFQKSLLDFLSETVISKALILGTGGASKAVGYALKKLGISYKKVSTAQHADLRYEDLTEKHLKEHQLIINATPLGTFPNVESIPNLPYKYLTTKNYLFDLVYNPSETAFMKAGVAQGSSACNGYQMLVNQAEKSWKIWNRPTLTSK